MTIEYPILSYCVENFEDIWESMSDSFDSWVNVIFLEHPALINETYDRCFRVLRTYLKKKKNIKVNDNHIELAFT